MRAVLEALTRRSAVGSIGLDLGQSALRAAQLRREADRWVVAGFGVCGRRAPERGGDENQFAARAARWLEKLGLHGRNVVVGLSPPDIELHALELASLDKSGDAAPQPGAVRAEIERLTGLDPENLEIDFWSVPAGAAKRASAVGVAARREGIDVALRICDAACLDCHQIDATPCALARFGSVYRGIAALPEDIWSVLDLGSRLSRVILCLGGVPVLVRAFSHGGRRWTEKLAEALRVSPQTAEQHKRDCGIDRGAGAADGVDGGMAAATLGEMIFNVLRADLEEMGAEIERSYRYVMNCFPGRTTGPIVLAGAGGALRGLDRWLADRLGVEVLLPDRHTPQECRLDLSICRAEGVVRAGELAGAIGLALPMDACHG